MSLNAISPNFTKCNFTLGYGVKSDELFTVSFIIIFAFHPEPNQEEIIMDRNFEDMPKHLADVSYMPRDMLAHCN